MPKQPAEGGYLFRTWTTVNPHLASILAAVFALLIPLKVLRVAHGDTTIALGITTHGDKAAIVTGLLILLLPQGLAVVFGAACALSGKYLGQISQTGEPAEMNEEERSRLKSAVSKLVWCALLLAVGTWLLAAVAPWSVAVAAVVIAVPFSGMVYWQESRPRKPVAHPERVKRLRRASLAKLLAGGVFVAAILAIDPFLTPVLDDRVWLPAHQLVLSSGHSEVAYIVSESDSAITILTEGDRSLVQIPRSTVSGDVLCHIQRNWSARSLWDLSLGNDRSSVPDCR